ncbi:MAG: bacterioferritin [Bdellovibrionales bacterium GWB1_55_8]|nr:MAG: bacterioferritin [Bdellovibrionales bacterium GWB1_55_8]
MKNSSVEKKSAFNEIGGNVPEIKRGARQSVEEGALTPGYEGDVELSIRLLNEVLATEIVCALRYRQNAFTAQGLHHKPIAEEFMEHSNEEQGHADDVAQRIKQLGGTPHMNPDELMSLSHADYMESESLEEMIRGNIISERIAIDSYRSLAQYFGDKDPTSRRLMEKLLEKEEEHADELSDFLRNEEPSQKKMTA